MLKVLAWVDVGVAVSGWVYLFLLSHGPLVFELRVFFVSGIVPSRSACHFGTGWCISINGVDDLGVLVVYIDLGPFTLERNSVYTNNFGMTLHFGCFTIPAGHAACLVPQAAVITEWL